MKLPNGTEIEDYTVVRLNDGVHIVATDENDNLIAITEYKYGADESMMVLPAGNIESGEDPVVAAKRELEEETGYTGGEFSFVAELHDFPSKALHKAQIVRAKNVRKNSDTAHEATEQIENVHVIPLAELKQRIAQGDFKNPTNIAGMTLALSELFLR